METKKRLCGLEFRYGIGFILAIVVQLAFIKLIEVNGWVETLDGNFIFLLEMLPVMLIAYPIFILIVSKVPKNIEIEKHKLSVGQILLLFMVAWSAIYVSNLAGTLITQLMGIILGHDMGNVVMTIVSTTNVPTQILVVVILAPIFEELLFRKLIIDRVAGYGEKTAVILSAALFALYHGNVGQAVYAFALGTLFGAIYLRTGEIKYTIILHAMVNFFGSVAAGILLEKTNILDLLTQITTQTDPLAQAQIVADNAMVFLIYAIYVVIIFGIVIAGGIVFFMNKSKLAFVSRETDIPKGEIFKTVYVNWGMLLCVVITLALIVRSAIVGAG